MFLRVSRISRDNACAGVSSLLKGRLWLRRFPVGFAEFLGMPFLIERLRATASVTKNVGVTNKQHKITTNMVDLTKSVFSFGCITTPRRL